MLYYWFFWKIKWKVKCLRIHLKVYTRFCNMKAVWYILQMRSYKTRYQYQANEQTFHYLAFQTHIWYILFFRHIPDILYGVNGMYCCYTYSLHWLSFFICSLNKGCMRLYIWSYVSSAETYLMFIWCKQNTFIIYHKPSTGLQDLSMRMRKKNEK